MQRPAGKYGVGVFEGKGEGKQIEACQGLQALTPRRPPPSLPFKRKGLTGRAGGGLAGWLGWMDGRNRV